MKVRVVFFVSVTFFIYISVGELLELSIEEKAKLPENIRKAVDLVEAGVKINFKFARVFEAIRFIESCNYINYSLTRLADKDWDGVAGDLKSIMNATELNELCSVKPEVVEQFRSLDEIEPPVGYLSAHMLKEVLKLKIQLDTNEAMNKMLGFMYRRKKHFMGEDLLKFAGNNIDLFMDELDPVVPNRYKSCCEISLLRPICKLVCLTKDENVNASGRDIADFRIVLATNDETKLSEYTEVSGVSLNELKTTCTSAYRNLLPAKMIEIYKKANFLTEQQIKATAKTDAKFDFYFQLYQLCQVQTA